jgi:ABC-type polysaccharide/polyol phosphate export permease
MHVMRFNPFYYYLELMRAPMLGDWPDLEQWGIALAITALLWTAALLLFRKMRSQIVYWL